jgi:hypothetical protein
MAYVHVMPVDIHTSSTSEDMFSWRHLMYYYHLLRAHWDLCARFVCLCIKTNEITLEDLTSAARQFRSVHVQNFQFPLIDIESLR